MNAREMGLEVTLRVGKRTTTHRSIEDARASYVERRDLSGHGASTWPDGIVVASGVRIRISYNGRLWDTDGNSYDSNNKGEETMTIKDLEKRKNDIENFVKNKKAQASSTETNVTPAKKPTMKIPATLNATSGKSKKTLRKENEAKRDPSDPKKEADREIDDAVKPKAAAKKEKDASMLSVSQIATELGLDPKRARSKLRNALEANELPEGLAVVEGRWPLVKRDGKQHKQVIAMLKPKSVKSDETPDDEDEE